MPRLFKMGGFFFSKSKGEVIKIEGSEGVKEFGPFLLLANQDNSFLFNISASSPDSTVRTKAHSTVYDTVHSEDYSNWLYHGFSYFKKENNGKCIITVFINGLLKGRTSHLSMCLPLTSSKWEESSKALSSSFDSRTN